MTGADHYRDAERNFELAKDAESGSKSEAFHLAAAQIHATLALAAATAHTPYQEPNYDEYGGSS